MLKAGEKRKKPKEQVLADFFNHEVSVKLAADLLGLQDNALATFFKLGYEAIQVVGGEVTKSAIGFGDPEKLIRDAGSMAHATVQALGRRIEQLAERIQGNG